MNGLEILGLGCVDATFRRQLFENVDAVINLNRADLTWAEEEGLRRITKRRFQKRSPAAEGGPVALAMEGAAASGEEVASSLEADMRKVGDVISMMCPTVPCAWPDSFVQNDPNR